MSADDLKEQLPCPCGANNMGTVTERMMYFYREGLQCKSCGLTGKMSDAWQITVVNWNAAVKAQIEAGEVSA